LQKDTSIINFSIIIGAKLGISLWVRWTYVQILCRWRDFIISYSDSCR